MILLKTIVIAITFLWSVFSMMGVLAVKDFSGKVFFGIMAVLCVLIANLLLI